MPRVIQAAEFFVVGGPVQPDRSCYIERPADDALYEAVREQRFSYVFAPRASGKSSLMARTIRRLRSEGQLAAVVDLTQIGARGESGEAGRWYYSIAYRIVRELRLKVDLQSWWQEKSALMSEQRLAEFFWEIVLTHTSAPVTVFFDEIERAVPVPFSQELFSAIRSCYTGRATEPDFNRLNFVVLGVTSAASLCPDRALSPFELGRAIDLEDFSAEDCHQLAPGFEIEPALACALIDRIHTWTGGQPYLTQKVARGVVRRGGHIDDVERIVKAQFVGASSGQTDPLLNHVRSVLTAPGPHTRQALGLLARLGRGERILADAGSRAQSQLWLSGVVIAGDDNVLRFRNRIFAAVFTPRWVGAAMPFDWRRVAAVAAVAALAVGLPLWYTQYLPRPYVRTLSVVTEDFAVAEEAYRGLRRLPGFRGTADRLFADVLARRSVRADSHAEVLAADEQLRNLPGYEPLAEELLGRYWLQRAEEARHRERRDDALLAAVRALPGQPAAARSLASELIGDDYPRLMRSFRLPAVPAHWEADWRRQVLTLVDAAHRFERLPFDALAASGGARAARLTVLQPVPVSRELSVDDAGPAGRLELVVAVSHASIADLRLTLETPSGARAELALRAPAEGAGAVHRFTSDDEPALARLAEQERQGVWRMTLVDGRAGAAGVLDHWGLGFAQDSALRIDEPQQGVPIPDPVRTEQAEIGLSGDGRWAVAVPSRRGAIGALSVWDLVQGRLHADLPMQTAPDVLRFNGDGSRLLAATPAALAIWNVAAATPVAEHRAADAFLLPPAIGTEGDYVALAEPAGDGRPAFRLLRVADGEQVATTAGMDAGVRAWALAPQARYLALLGPSRRIRLLDPRRGRLLDELVHTTDVERLIPVSGDWLVVVDAAGGITAWPIGAPGGEQRHLGTTAGAESVIVSADGSMIAFQAAHDRVIARDLLGERQPLELRIETAGAPIRTQLSPDGRSLITASSGLFQYWRLDGMPPALGAELALSALALDAAGRIVTLGMRSGQVRVNTAARLGGAAAETRAVDYIGHQGPVTSLASNAELGLVASGGADGVVRRWDLASASPSNAFMRHPSGPVHEVALSPDGRWIGSAAEYSARIWHASSGELAGEIPVNGAALTLAFAPDSTSLAIGDSAGNVFFAVPDARAPSRSSRAQSAVRALAFAPGGRRAASGDDAGYVQLWDADSAGRLGEPAYFRHPVRWVGFSPDGRFLAVQTHHWLHRLQVGQQGLTLLDSRLLDAGLEAGARFVAPGGTQLRFVGGLDRGQPSLRDVDLRERSAAMVDPQLLRRDWPSILGLAVDPAGRIVPVRP